MFSKNAELVIKEFSGRPSSFDPDTGQPVFTECEVRIALSVEDTKPPISETLPGLENVLGYVEGRCLESLPEGFSIPSRCQIEIELQGQTKLLGFYTLPRTVSRLGLDAVFGQAVAGWLIDM